ncbi:MAG: VOC family protein [Syntrophomonadaceae bacterium]
MQLTHIGMVVKDCEKSSSFYTRVLGCEKSGEYQDEKMKFVFLDFKGQSIELIQYLAGETTPRLPGPLDHIAVEVKDIDKEIARLKEMGVELLAEAPREVLNGKKIIFLAGPDGERIELVQEP